MQWILVRNSKVDTDWYLDSWLRFEVGMVVLAGACYRTYSLAIVAQMADHGTTANVETKDGTYLGLILLKNATKSYRTNHTQQIIEYF